MQSEGPKLGTKTSRPLWRNLGPAVVRGNSGVGHDFTYLATKGDQKQAFDVLHTIDELDVISARAKSYDTDLKVTLVCPGGAASDSTKKLAEEYGIPIITGSEMLGLFEPQVVPRREGPGQESSPAQTSTTGKS